MKRSKVPSVCDQCGKNFEKEKYDFKRTQYNFCSRQCSKLFRQERITIPCSNCGRGVKRTKSQCKKSKSGRAFCNQACAASYNNQLKRKSRRSKIEKKLFKVLQQKFPALVMLPNDKTMLDGFEADIAIPSLQLAIEWNGIVHFKPIWGEEKLQKIQDRDSQKKAIAISKNINLIVVPDLVSNDKILDKAVEEISDIIEVE